jgi:hypothetical protein
LERVLAQIDEEITEIFIALPQLWNKTTEHADGALLHITRVRLSELEARRAIVLSALAKVNGSVAADS